MSNKQDRYKVVRQVGEALLRFMQQIEAVYERSAQTTEMHPTDFRAICLLGEQKAAMRPTEIGHALGLTSGAVSALILRLESRNLIFREPNPEDRRGVLISLNPQAAAPSMQEYTALHAHYKQITDGFTDAELQAVARYLENLRQVTMDHLAIAGAERGTWLHEAAGAE